jgi:DNA-binding CsgD family transcriptional regulator
LLLDEARRRRFISAVAVSGWAPIAWELLHGDIERAIDELVEWRNDSVPEGSFTGIWSHFPYEALVAAGRVADARAEFEKARADLPEAVAVRARCQLNVVEGLLGLAEGELADAEAHIYEALTEQHALGWRPALAHSLEGLAHVSACHRAHRDCARFAGAAQRLRHELGYVLRWPFEAQLLTSDLADARAELGDDGFDAAFTEGRALDDDAVVAYATRARGERGRPAFGWDSLTPTEHSVAVLVAQGLTNKEVARELLMGAETVKTHVSRIYTKLGVPNRSALSAALAAKDRAH